MKRFYKEAAAVEAAGGYGLALDGKPVRTPAGRRLVAPNAALANALADEWAAQGETVDRAAMPLTRLVATALDLAPEHRVDAVAEIARYAETDLVCYRVAHPPALAGRQEEAWQPLVDWAAERYGARLVVTTGLTPVPQPPAALAALRAAVEAGGGLRFCGLDFATRTLGSLVVALALLERRVTAADAAAASLVDERYQLDRWGCDEALAARCDRLARDVADADRFFRLLEA